MDNIIETLPQHSISWLKGMLTFYKYRDFWSFRYLIEGGILAQQSFKANPSDILLCSCPKTGTTWLKALAFAIVTREKFDVSNSPLLTTLPHNCVPYLETGLDQIQNNRNNPSCFPLMATHLPYSSLPESVLSSNCKIVYIYRNIKDVIVSHYHHLRGVAKLSVEDAPFEVAFKEFCEGISGGGPYWDHIIGYLKASLERSDVVLLLKYEDLKTDPTSNVKRLAEFIGYPFSIKEVKDGTVVDNIIRLCSFENLSNLEVNKSGKQLRNKGKENIQEIENRLFFRKAMDGDWKNYFTDEMTEKIDKLMDEKLGGTGLVLK